VTLWLVPSEAIREQTLRAMKRRGDVVCETLREMGSVAVMGIEEAMTLPVSTLETSEVVIVATMQAFKRDNPDALNVYKQNGALMPHFSGLPKEAVGNHSLVDALKLRRPFVVVDEAHNQGSDLAFDTLARFAPCAILELTATPDRKNQPSNVLHSVSASALHAEDMIKMPVEVHGHPNEKVVLREALARLNHLQALADEEMKAGGAYLRPVMLLQAQRQTAGQETLTPDKVKAALVEDFNIPPAQVAICTGAVDELGDTDVMSSDCLIRFIITVDKLREGWDCPFASVLCTFRESASATAIEQLLGRILRQPYQTRKQNEALNLAYAYAVCADSRWLELVQNIGQGLVRCGFEQMDAKDLVVMPQVTDPLPLWGQNVTVTLPVVDNKVETLNLEALPASLLKKIDVGEDSITLPANLTAKDEAALYARAPVRPPRRQSRMGSRERRRRG
jgi:type III restriction enzyme